jgi:hypothetical protein
MNMALGLLSKDGSRDSGTPFSFTITGEEPVVSTEIALMFAATAGPACYKHFLMVSSSPSI